MRKITSLALLCLAFVLASCTKESVPTQPQTEEGDLVAISISANLSDMMTKAAAVNPGSNLSGIGNVDPDKYSVRYILEIWDEVPTTAVRVHTDRKAVAIDANAKSVSFTANLLRGKEYRFVVWADIIKGTDAKVNHHYVIGADLSDIKLAATSKSEYVVNDDSKDAFFVSETQTVSSKPTPDAISLTLKRPLGKIRFIASDYNTVKNDATITNATFRYSSSTVYAYTNFNAITGAVDATKRFSVNNSAVADYPHMLVNDELTLFWDYMFVPDATGMRSQFYVGCAYELNSAPVTLDAKGFTDARIIVKPNYLTTVRANIFTSTYAINIDIDDSFDGYINPEGDVFIGSTSYATITDAMAAAVTGDVVSVRDGIYNENVNVKAGVTLEGAGVTTIITGKLTVGAGSTLKNFTSSYSGTPIGGSSMSREVLLVNSPDVTIDGVVFEATSAKFLNGGNPEAIVLGGAAENFTLTNSTIKEPYWKGIYVNSIKNLTVTGNVFECNPFSVDNFMDGSVTVTGNTFIRNGMGNTRMINFACVDAPAGFDGAVVTTWPAGLEAVVGQIKTANTWNENILIYKYPNAVRVGSKYVINDGANAAAGWEFK